MEATGESPWGANPVPAGHRPGGAGLVLMSRRGAKPLDVCFGPLARPASVPIRRPLNPATPRQGDIWHRHLVAHDDIGTMRRDVVISRRAAWDLDLEEGH